MIGTVSWVLMLAAGFGALVLMKKTHTRLEPLLERFAAAAFLAAGLIGATGWLGEWMRSVTDWLMSLGDDAGRSLVGTAIVWILAAGLGIAWVGAFLPARWAKWRYPDWLVLSGFFLPGLLTGVPGGLGELLRGGTELAGQGAVWLVSWAVGAPQA